MGKWDPYKWKIGAGVRERLFGAISDERYMTTDEIAKILFESRRSVQRKLCLIYSDESLPRSLERAVRPANNGGVEALWRKIPAGVPPPLFDTPLGLDARALSNVWGGYGFKQQEETWQA